MADITIRLILYRVGETYSKMAEAAGSMYANLTWQNYLLDILLLAWLGWAVTIILLVNAFFHFHGPLKIPANDPWAETSGFIRCSGSGEAPDYRTNFNTASPSGLTEKCFWLNALLDWFYNRVDSCPIIVDTWILSLNEQARKLGGPVQIKIEKLEPGSPPPKISDIKYESGTKTEDYFVINYFSDARNLSFSMFASQKTHTGMKLTNCLCDVARYQAKVKLYFKYTQGHIILTTSFDGQPLAKVKVKPINPYQESEEVVDLGVVEEVVRNALCMSSVTINMSDYLGLSSSFDSSHDLDYRPLVTFPEFDEEMPVRTSLAQQSTLPFKRVPALTAPPPKPPRAVGDKRLFVKIIKATSLGGRDVGTGDPFCVIIMDSPYQKYETTVVRNTVSPFWDEHFLLDVSPASTLLRFELYDKGKSPADEFLGDATIYIEDVRKTPSSRQIIPLQSPSGSMEYQVGSLTVEFLLMEPFEVEQYMDSALGPKNLRNNQTSPRRRVEVSRTITPGGTVVTTTTTTTQRPQYGTLLPGNQSVPCVVEKLSPYSESSKNSPSTNQSSPSFGGRTDKQESSEMIVINNVESVAETAIRELLERSKRPRTPTKTSTLIITSVKREPVVPVIKTIDSLPGEDNIDSPSSASADKSQTGSTVSDKEKKKSFSLAKTLKKRFGRSKVRSQSADRAQSLKSEGGSITYLSPTESSFKPMSKSTEDINGISLEVPPIKKSSSLGGSLKKLFRRGRKRTRDPGETSRESSLSRSSMRYPASSREGSIDSTRSPYVPTLTS
ncbi:C2 domain-containing protein 2 isoform X3 [Octopus sinensis]|uniref:C2 domain-containing protein 2 isoform X3 n=1 Tax=Octopus sinensis TaxID=2607531 RepID=A0A6P7T8S7_9MOLL|nr:C2 domain-containing protein 2 isoform X3 [Octopus sinensis]